jgi:hypothetical protein
MLDEELVFHPTDFDGGLIGVSVELQETVFLRLDVI